jgi:tryptophanyl-tRNA synthetase
MEHESITPPGSSLYDETVAEIVRVARDIAVDRTSGDGRIDSAMKEIPFLTELQTRLLAAHSTWEIAISPPRASCDVLINGLRINLKLTDCKTSDNSVNKPALFYSITGLTTYPYSSNWNDFLAKLSEAKAANGIKRVRDRASEYHYLVKNKLTGDVLLKPVFDIHTYVSNASNDLQINWKNEFANRDYAAADGDYMKKVQSLLETIQTSVREMIRRTKEFAEADMSALLN